MSSAALSSAVDASITAVCAEAVLDPMALFISDARDGDYETCVHAINQLCTVALAIGPARTRSQLVPFLTEFSEEENDEAQAAVARQLAHFPALLGGPQYLHLVLLLLEKYCGEEEFVVRDTAVATLNQLIPQLPKADLLNKFVPILKRLANGDWFTTRVSATGLFATCYPLVPDAVQVELRSLFNNLCNDDTPMVRKAAFTHLGRYAQNLQRPFFRTDIFPIVKAISVDDVDNMRIYAIDACASLGSVVDFADFSSVLAPVIEAMQDDSSWRVRSSLARQFPKIASSIQPSNSVQGFPGSATSFSEAIINHNRKLFALFIKLLRDKEAEVKAAACEVLDRIFTILTSDSLPLAREFMESCHAVLESLTVDPASNVKVALSKSLVGLCPSIGKELSLKWIIPMLTTLSKDENQEARHHSLLHINSLVEICGIQAVSQLILPILIDSIKDPKWRVRYACLQPCYLLAQHLGSKGFDKRVLNYVIGALADHVYGVRQIACRQLGLITSIQQLSSSAESDAGQFGARWACEQMLPLAFVLYDKNTNYLHRMTVLLLLEEIVSCYNNTERVSIAASRNIDDDIVYTHATSLANSTNLIDVNNNNTSSNENHGRFMEIDSDFAELLEKHAAPIILQACTDDVPNVRVAAAKTLTLLLSKMRSDLDPDAAFFAEVALRAISTSP